MCKRKLMSQDPSILFGAEIWGWGVKKAMPSKWHVADFHSSDPIMSTLALTFLYNDNFCFVILPYPGPETSQPVKNYCNSQPASLPAACLTSSPCHAAYTYLTSLPNISHGASSTMPPHLWMSQPRRFDVQTELLPCILFMPLSACKIPTSHSQLSSGITSKCIWISRFKSCLGFCPHEPIPANAHVTLFCMNLLTCLVFPLICKFAKGCSQI